MELKQLVDERVNLGDRAGAANTGGKVMTTLKTFLRSFTLGTCVSSTVRDVDRRLKEKL